MGAYIIVGSAVRLVADDKEENILRGRNAAYLKRQEIYI